MLNTAQGSGEPDHWQTLCENRILFGHQSVGSNLLDGVTRLIPDLPIHPCDGSGADLSAGINHFRAGENHKPVSKLEHFEARVAEHDGACELAAVKFCYVDIRASTDIDALFERYTTTLDGLIQQFPSIRFFHFTTPLRTLRPGLRSRLKSLIGQPIPVCEDNIQREAFNNMLRQRYAAEGALFDLASLETGAPERPEYQFGYRGTKIRALHPEYTTDGGHLNTLGATTLASALLDFLAEQIKKAP